MEIARSTAGAVDRNRTVIGSFRRSLGRGGGGRDGGGVLVGVESVGDGFIIVGDDDGVERTREGLWTGNEPVWALSFAYRVEEDAGEAEVVVCHAWNAR